MGILQYISFSSKRLPPPPRRFTVENVQTRYFILTWNEPENASLYQIQKYTVERRTLRSENFILVKTVPYPDTQMILENLDPSTEYTIRLSSNNMNGRSEGVLVTQRTLPGRILAGCYRFTILISVSTYTANLAAFFTVRNAENPTNNLEEIMRSFYQVGAM